jgi:hypothetical protein
MKKTNSSCDTQRVDNADTLVDSQVAPLAKRTGHAVVIAACGVIPEMMSSKSAEYAAIGSNGIHLVVWGLGATEDEAQNDAETQSGGEDVEFTILPCTQAAAIAARRGEVNCETGRLVLDGYKRRRGEWTADRLSVRAGRTLEEETARTAQLPRVRVTEALEAAVRACAEREDVDISELVRRALVRFIEIDPKV